MEEKKSQNKKLFYGVLILIGIIALVGGTYAWFSIMLKGQTTQIVQAGDLSLTIENENALTLAKALPVKDSDGIKENKEYTFVLSNNGLASLSYAIKLINDKEMEETCQETLNGKVPCTMIPEEYIRYQVIEEGASSTIGGLKGNSQIATGTIKGKEKKKYTLKIWLSGETPNEYKHSYYFGKLEITGTQTGEFVDGANVPELVDGLIPVTWNGTDWVSADTTSKWYNYNEQWWANAVTTTATNRTKYQTPGTVVPISDINTMWVWIPRYEYQFSNLADQYAGGTAELPGGITINFIDKNVTTPSDAANYVVHPAFTFGDDELSGIWVGKFETGNQTACTVTESVVNSACDLTTLGAQIKPNVNSWRGIRVSTAFTVSREMSNAGNVYGLNKTTTDSHMMKNTEWGAVAYLSQSVYGKYGNTNYTGANKEVYINNYANNGTLTGCSAGAPSIAIASTCAYTYEKSNIGTGASTTGNIYGVYDMSGGSYEYVMGNMKADGSLEQQSGYQNTNNYNSGFTGINYDKTQVSERAYPDTKYYDTYSYDTSYDNYSSRYIPGDATYEVSQGDGNKKGWYSDSSYFVNTGLPWFWRGGAYDSKKDAGIFLFSSHYGGAHNSLSFRLVLASVA